MAIFNAKVACRKSLDKASPVPAKYVAPPSHASTYLWDKMLIYENMYKWEKSGATLY
jgi:hypothetical protein